MSKSTLKGCKNQFSSHAFSVHRFALFLTRRVALRVPHLATLLHASGVLPQRLFSAINLTGPSSPDTGTCGAPPPPPPRPPAAAAERTRRSGAAPRSPAMRFVHSLVTLICTVLAPARIALVTFIR